MWKPKKLLTEESRDYSVDRLDRLDIPVSLRETLQCQYVLRFVCCGYTARIEAAGREQTKAQWRGRFGESLSQKTFLLYCEHGEGKLYRPVK